MRYKITVSKPYLPELDQYLEYLERLWSSRWLTNNGEMVKELEKKLREYLQVPYIYYVSNGTVALQIALKALDIEGEVITTPFSFIATSSAILWENLQPVYVDIRKDNYCIDADKIEEKVTSKTRAILVTHVYGHPCDVDKIRTLADEYRLPVVYDGAHAFGTKINGVSLLSFGDVSTVSFHATKLFHTIEGGAVITHNLDIARKVEVLRNFGIRDGEIIDIGINAKNSEFHAALGLSTIGLVPDMIKKRKFLSNIYDNILKETTLTFPKQMDYEQYNYAYYPVVFQSEDQLIRVKKNLEKVNIESRRYFYPSLNKLRFIGGEECPISENIARTVLCLPLYYDLLEDECEHIAKVVKESIE